VTGTITQALDLSLVDPDPLQPRQVFDQEALQERADSSVGEGLMQPITVRPKPDGRFEIVAGERRWRAHQLAGLPKIDAHVREMDDHTKMVQALIENGVRKDITMMEEAVAYRRCLDAGMTPEDLARRLGMKSVWRIAARTDLLRLRPEYQTLLSGGGLTGVQAHEMSSMTYAGQDKLFDLIRIGKVDHLNVRAMAAAVRTMDQQEVMFALPAGPSDMERKLAAGLEHRFSRVINVLRASTVDCEVIAARKVNPARAGTLADMAREMAAELIRIEAALRAVPQPELLDAA
jgi:ParB family chromosome partitioning protein